MRSILVLSLFLGSRLYALPTLYPDYFNKSIRNNTGSNIMADSESSHRFYVLPPNVSFSKVKSLHTVSANVGFCAEIAKLQEYNLDTVKLLNSLKDKDVQFKIQIETENKKLSSANEELSKYVLANNLQEISALDLKITQLEKRLDHLYIIARSCNKECDAINSDIQTSQLLRAELTTRRFELSAGNVMLSNEYEKKKSYVESLRKNIESINTNWRELQRDLKDLYADFSRMYDAHSLREGGKVAIEYYSGWDENVARLQQDNPGYSFEKIQTKNASIKMNAYSKNMLVPGGAVMAFDAGGISPNGALTLESFPANLNANVTLNLLGVCPLIHPELFGFKNEDPMRAISYGLTVAYEYPSRMKFDITAHYNMYRMYKIIKSQGSSGGFFSSSSWSNQEEEELFSDSFRVDWNVQDDKIQIPYEKKLAINADIRRQMLSRLASFLVMNDQSAKLGSIAQAPATGATVLADSLNKTCSSHVYCKGASIVLNVLQAIFGSANNEQQIQQKTDVNMMERYSDSSVVMQPMLTTYR